MTMRFMSGQELEDYEFEQGAENMELRAMRIAAEAELAKELDIMVAELEETIDLFFPCSVAVTSCQGRPHCVSVYHPWEF